MRRNARPIGLLVGVTALLAACGENYNGGAIAAPAGTLSNPRTVEVAMVDIAFEPTAIDVRAGETIRFVFTNEGVLPHEAIIGDEVVQDDHEVDMQAGGDFLGDDMSGEEMTVDDHDADTDEAEDDGHDADIPSLSLEPGETGEIIMTFDAGGNTIIGCHVPGHWAAGMRQDVTVESA